MLTTNQKTIINLRKKYTQEECAKILNVSQPNISKIENTIKNNIKKSIDLINFCNKKNNILKYQFKSTAFSNAVYLLPFIDSEYEITGVSAQYILLNYYKLSNEIEIISNDPKFEKLWGCKLISEKPSNIHQIKNSLILATNEKIVHDCLKRDDIPGYKSAIFMILNYKLDHNYIRTNYKREILIKLCEIIHLINIVFKEYGFEKRLKFPDIKIKRKENIEIKYIINKVIDDFIPFIKSENNEL
jgi:transcriptional regulator with XRE-family HTH domain